MPAVIYGPRTQATSVQRVESALDDATVAELDEFLAESYRLVSR